MKKVILYNIDRDPEKGKRIRETVEAAGAEWKVLDPEELGYTVGHIIGREGFEDEEKVSCEKPPKSTFALFSGFDDGELEKLVDDMRENRAAIGAKATVTEHNVNWRFFKLMEAVVKEHAIMKQYTDRSRKAGKKRRS